MKYYIILLKNGAVIDVCSFDDEDARDKQARKFESDPWQNSNQYFDDVQKINIVN